MSGLATISTIAAIGGAAVSAGSLAYGIVNGQAQSDAQSQALKKQNTAQQTAQANALSTQRQSEVAQAQSNQATPDITAILKRAAATGTGLSSTMLTGSTGVDTGSLNLGKATLLGQ